MQLPAADLRLTRELVRRIVRQWDSDLRPGMQRQSGAVEADLLVVAEPVGDPAIANTERRTRRVPPPHAYVVPRHLRAASSTRCPRVGGASHFPRPMREPGQRTPAGSPAPRRRCRCHSGPARVGIRVRRWRSGRVRRPAQRHRLRRRALPSTRPVRHERSRTAPRRSARHPLPRHARPPAVPPPPPPSWPLPPQPFERPLLPPSSGRATAGITPAVAAIRPPRPVPPRSPCSAQRRRARASSVTTHHNVRCSVVVDPRLGIASDRSLLGRQQRKVAHRAEPNRRTS